MKSISYSLMYFLFGLCFAAGCSGESSNGETCSDGVKNQNETDVDCGGICTKCENGSGCVVGSDCVSGNCSSGTCESLGASCDDGVQNQDETDIDCGGQKCDGCAEGKRCNADGDCQGGMSCQDGACGGGCVPQCDGKCGGAGDDCGGTCEECPSGKWCDGQTCKTCNADTHCGDDCVDCSSQDTNKACVDGACGCTLASDCKEAETCRNGSCVSVSECQSQDDCYLGDWCDAGQCVSCDSDEHCGFDCVDCSSHVQNKACVDGKCACIDDMDCADGESCESGQCTGCVPNCDGKCGGADDGCDGLCNNDCPVGQTCFGDQRCHSSSCELPSDCPDEFICYEGNCRYAACIIDGDCYPGEKCLGGLCTIPECSLDSDCTDGDWCSDYMCVPCDSDAHCGPACFNCTDPSIGGSCGEDAMGNMTCICQSDQDCRDGLWCDQDMGLCAECNFDTHCGPDCINCSTQANNKVCVNGNCGCVSNGDCANGDICQDGICTGCMPDCTGKCTGGDDGCGGTCQQECGQGLWCNSGTCETCSADDHCGPFCQDCTDGAINGDHCWESGGGYYCACFDASGCTSGYYCDGGAPAGICTECNTDAHCGESCYDCASANTNKACVNGTCGCIDSEDCASGESCVSAYCVQSQPEDCTNRADDDNDGLTDCEDSEDCPEFESCGHLMHCRTGACEFCFETFCHIDLDCRGCDNMSYCNRQEGCCTSCPDCPCL